MPALGLCSTSRWEWSEGRSRMPGRLGMRPDMHCDGLVPGTELTNRLGLRPEGARSGIYPGMELTMDMEQPETRGVKRTAGSRMGGGSAGAPCPGPSRSRDQGGHRGRPPGVGLISGRRPDGSGTAAARVAPSAPREGSLGLPTARRGRGHRPLHRRARLEGS